MPLRPNMLAEISAAIAGMTITNLTASSAGYDIYEAYIWSLALKAAKNEGASIRFKDRSNNYPTSFYFRTSPSEIYSSAQNYCHAEIEFSGCPLLEAHVGVYVSGKSQVPHEFDLAILYKSEADICRNSSVRPRSSKVIIAAECKYYLKSSIGVNLGRSFLGLVSDIYDKKRYFIGTKESKNVCKLFSNHNKNYELELSPLNPRLEDRLVGAFEINFRDFVASQA